MRRNSVDIVFSNPGPADVEAFDPSRSVSPSVSPGVVKTVRIIESETTSIDSRGGNQDLEEHTVASEHSSQSSTSPKSAGRKIKLASLFGTPSKEGETHHVNHLS